MKTNESDAICAAAGKLFMPSQTLKMPSVRVSRAKYSTVPKSDTVSMSTRARPATIAGRASGRPTLVKRFWLCTRAVSNNETGVNLKAVRAMM